MSRLDDTGLTRPAVASHVAWDLASLAVVMVVPVWLYLGLRPTSLSVADLPLVLAMGLGYLIGSVLGRSVRDRPWTPLWAGPAGFAAAYGILVLVPDIPASRAVALLSAVLGTSLLLLRGALDPRLRAGGAMAATVVVTGLVLVDVPGARTFFETAVPTAAETRLTGLHGMRVTSFSLPALAGRRGGGLVQAGSVLVMADGAGSLGVLDRASPGTWRRIDVATPMDTEPMRDAAGRDDHAGRMRVMDVAVRRDGEGWELFLSHHVFRLDEGCFAVRVSRIRLDSSLVSARPGEDWGAVFETRPCVPYFQEDRGEPHFRGNDSGGRLAWLEPEVLLLTVGDHMRDGLAADRGSDYGKTIRLDLSGPVAVASHFTTGHRNPQGVAVADGVVWETEHGPQGGDELNRLVEGADYGWDRSSLGTDYGALTFESVASTPPAAGAEVREPVYAWMPSLGVSDIAVVEGSGFHRWKGDLLIASLKAGSLRRLRLSGDRVVYDEPIPLGRRIRAITEDSQGAFWLRTDGPEVLRLEVDDSGAEAWGRCTQCHGLVEDPALAGPQLGDVEGRRVASVPGFAYSPALQAVRGTWTRARLDAFLADPQSLAPGTTMEMDPIVDPEVRRRILDHMAAADRR